MPCCQVMTFDIYVCYNDSKIELEIEFYIEIQLNKIFWSTIFSKHTSLTEVYVENPQTRDQWDKICKCDVCLYLSKSLCSS